MRFLVQKRSVGDFEELRSVVPTARTEVTQVDAGRLDGRLSHYRIGDLPFDVASFSLGVRSRGVVSADRVSIGMLTGSEGRVTHWSHEMRPGDVVVWPPGTEHDARYFGGASVAVISLSPAELASMFGSEPKLREIGGWSRSHYRPTPLEATQTISRLLDIAGRIDVDGRGPTLLADEFLKRAIVDLFVSPILRTAPSDRDGPLPSALRIVKKVEDHVKAAGGRPVHVTELCERLHVSRRTLHRAFHDAVGTGPVTFLRHNRLCAVHSMLRRCEPATTTVAAAASKQGFVNLGRFSADYKTLFGVYPSQTMRARPQS
jgi:AraC family ethanolamine operon transcriptional activator